METLTESINNGKSDWEKMQKRVLKESGEVEFRSDTPATAGVQGGQFTDVEDRRNLLKQNIVGLSNTPAYKEFRDKTQLQFSNAEKNELLKKIQSLKAKNVNSKSLYKHIDEFIHDYENTINMNTENISKNIDEFNAWSDDAVKRWTRGLGTQFRSFPTVKNKNEFKDVANIFSSSDPLSTDPSKPGHLVNYIIPLIKSDELLKESIVDEAKIRIPSPKYDIPKPITSTDLDGSGISPTTVDPQHRGPVAGVTSDKTKATTEEFARWLYKSSPETLQKMKINLTNILKSVGTIEKAETVIDGLNYMKNKLERFSKLGRKGADVTNTQKAALKLSNQDKEELDAGITSLEDTMSTTQPQQPQTEPVNESVIPRTKHGPGKIFDVNSTVDENVETVQDANKKKLKGINEGWEAYKKKNTPNKQKPNDFTLLMG